VIPQGGIISGSSSVVQLDAWNWEDAAYKTDIGIHFRMPSLARVSESNDPLKGAMDYIDECALFSAKQKHILKSQNMNIPI
jgi:hypothetical protein